QKRELSGPPKYFTTDWPAAFRSAKTLADLEPSVIATGHGKPISGPSLRDELSLLVEEFDTVSKPSHGRYVNDPALANEDGVVYIPERGNEEARTVAAVALVTTLIIAGFFVLKTNRGRAA
ncbi:MAG TPA: MBL fold metallo-hydrolase, partial [Chitinophagaceae bacterium]